MFQDAVVIKGYDFNKGVNLRALLESYARCGFQATKFGHAVREIDRMVSSMKKAGNYLFKDLVCLYISISEIVVY